MLLRSSSAPILTSLLPYSMESSTEPAELVVHLPRATSVFCLSQHLVETELHSNTPSPKKKCSVPPSPRSKVLRTQHSTKIKEIDEAKDPEQKMCMEAKSSVQGLFSSSGLDNKVVLNHEGCAGAGEGKQESLKLQTLVMDGGMGSNGSGRVGYGDGGGWEFFEGNNSNNGGDRTDAYYQQMIEANPNDSLLLGNYAKFLKEVRGDYPRAKEFFERAILATPSDGHILSLYADLIWQTEKNSDRAEAYFHQAINTSPEDCYVMASYAKFLWEAEDDDDDGDGRNELDNHTHSPDLFQGTKHHTHLTAAS
ncbi:hypothetical protein HN51_020933 [Arachis hypogaea]|uniref:Uncharacterized protein n=1 Tax=Arachis hypogaea TaxID=3818 RepID=A0A445EIP4_ARAHY|nr:uncharacterized protein LOC112731607 [Arachis hypogaea]QHO51796.1 uncharacterized protein DS421_2g34010 [Arachis hypogaea]RYR75308.1 hypothetical protein Ahy_A02g009963 [Arachis hypogaea]